MLDRSRTDVFYGALRRVAKVEASIFSKPTVTSATMFVYDRGDNLSTLTGPELNDLSDTTNTLGVHGNAGDQVILEGNWVDVGSHGFYHTYTQNDAVLLVGMNMAAVFG